MYTYYKPRYNINKIETLKCSYYDKQTREDLFESRDEAYKAIEALYPEAEERFNNIKREMIELQKKLGFESSFEIEGDTHSVDISEYVEFKVNNFVFRFYKNF